MASKLLNVRMDQEMIDELKKVCGELDISVTDAIKYFSNKLIEERTLNLVDNNSKEENTEKEEDFLEDALKTITELHEVNFNAKKFEEPFEEISDITLSYYHIFNKIISSSINEVCENPYEYFVNEFEKEYGEKLKYEIIKKLSEICKLRYDEIHSTYFEVYKQRQELIKEKELEAMNNLKKVNPDLYKELINQYSYDISEGLLYALDCKTYEEVKNKLESSLTKEEIREYLNYEKSSEEEREKLKLEIKEDETRWQRLVNAVEKIEKLREETIEKEEKNEELKKEEINNSEDNIVEGIVKENMDNSIKEEEK